MKTDSILEADVLDIIFEHRNKSYGAYTLRKFYNNRLYKSLGLVLLFAVAVFLMSFFRKGQDVISSNPYEFGKDPTMVAPPKDPTPEPPKPNQPKQMPAVAMVIPPDAGRVVLTKDPRDVKPIPDIPSGVPAGPAGPATGPGTGDPGVPFGGGVSPIPEPSAPPALPPVDKVTPMAFAEVMPSFPGGPEALRKFLERNLKNPEDMDAGQSVFVKIRFIVGFDGSLKGFETTEDGGAIFNNEVMRVLKKMPQWIPGKTRGENVSVYYVLPVKFTGAAE